jgi:hypothetical protein
VWRLRPSIWRAAWWAAVSVRRVRRALPHEGVRIQVQAPPALPRDSGRGVDAVLFRLSPTCLERALVAQRWLLAQGDRRDVVIGVPTGFRAGDSPAHAWLDGSTEAAGAAQRYTELHRLRADALVV